MASGRFQLVISDYERRETSNNRFCRQCGQISVCNQLKLSRRWTSDQPLFKTKYTILIHDVRLTSYFLKDKILPGVRESVYINLKILFSTSMTIFQIKLRTNIWHTRLFNLWSLNILWIKKRIKMKDFDQLISKAILFEEIHHVEKRKFSE